MQFPKEPWVSKAENQGVQSQENLTQKTMHFYSDTIMQKKKLESWILK